MAFVIRPVALEIRFLNHFQREFDHGAVGELVFDRQALLTRLMGDEALVKSIIAGFVKDMPGQMDALKIQIAQGDAGAAGGQAHSIKGAAANVGGLALSAVASEMEQAGKAGRLDAIAALGPELERQFDRLKEAMEKQDGTS